MTLALNDQLRIPEEVLTTKVGEEMILLNLQTGMYHSLDPSVPASSNCCKRPAGWMPFTTRCWRNSTSPLRGWNPTC